MNTPHSVLKDFSFRGGSRYGHPARNLHRKNTGNLHGEGFQKLQICNANLYSFPIRIWTDFEANFIENFVLTCHTWQAGETWLTWETWHTRSINLANTKLQPGKHEASTRQTRSFNPAKPKLQPSKHEASTRQAQSFNPANTELQLGKHEALTSKHEASTWQNEGSTWQTRSFNVANTKLCWLLVGGSWLLAAGCWLLAACC